MVTIGMAFWHRFSYSIWRLKLFMERRKKAILVSILMVLCLFLSACGGSGAPAGNTGTPAAGDNPIVVGYNLELTGGTAEFGQKGRNGAQLVFDKVNAEGGLLDGRLIEAVSADNKSEPGEATSATTKLITDNKVIAIIGPMTTAAVLGSLQIVTDNKVMLITPSGTNAALTVNEDGTLNEWVFRACFIDPFQGQVAANFAMNTLGAKTAAVAYDIVGDYSYGLASSFISTFEEAGLQIVSNEKFSAGDQDFRPIIENIKQTNPDVIFVPAYYNETGKFVSQARDAGITVPIMGGDGWGGGDMLGIAGAEKMNNTYYVDMVSLDDPTLAPFIEEYQAAYGEIPDVFSALGYDAALMFVEAVKQAGSAEPEAVRAALENLSFEGLSGLTIVDSATHNPAKGAVILEFVDGVKVFKEKVDPI
jgi:branched-chain amino acid transport system substrate-binding protein